MKKLLIIITLFCVVVYIGWDQLDGQNNSKSPTDQSNKKLYSTYGEHNSGDQAEGNGIVIKILPDDNDGSRHQRFILKLHSGQTLLIAHNTDLAPRLPSLKEGDTVAFNGEYEWNSKGGVVHWTHRDPSGRHMAGWLKHNGQTYQ
jgi:hypothetical protein